MFCKAMNYRTVFVLHNFFYLSLSQLISGPIYTIPAACLNVKFQQLS